MKPHFSTSEFYEELKLLLPTSTAAKRKIWVTTISENNIDLKDLFNLLACDRKIAMRFLWLLTEIGQLYPTKLLAELPYLFSICDKLNPVYKQSFATFWLTVGVPAEDEGKATDLLFKLLQSNDTTVTIKSRALLVLFELTKKYPELKNELRLCLVQQSDKHTNEFQKRATKILAKIGQD